MRATVCATIMERTVVPITAITGRITDRTTTGRTVTGRNQPELDCDGISAERRMSANGECDVGSLTKEWLELPQCGPPGIRGGRFSSAFRVAPPKLGGLSL